MGRWQRYWFAEGGRTSAALVRIGLAISVLLSLARIAATTSAVESHVYRPVGFWMLLGDTAPPAALVSVLWLVAWTSTFAMLVGAATRVSTALSWFSAVALAALSFSGSHTWSHQYNVVFLAQLAFLGARGGDTLSVDWLIRTRIRKLPALDIPRGYQWSLRLVQLAVVLMFAGAAFHKFAHGQFTLRWALSDNLRHHLLMKYDLAGIDRPAFVDWLLAESWRYQGAALLNMITQAAPLAAVIFVRRPLVRLFAAALFITEVIMLGVVVALWNLHWLPLAIVFVDVDHWVGKLRRRPPTHPEVPASWRPPRGPTIFIIAFVIYDVITAFIPTVDQRLNTFPFSSFPMFSTIRVRAPYGEHLPYSVVGGTFEITSDIPIDRKMQRWIDHKHRTYHTVRKPDELQKRLRTVLDRGQHFYYNYSIRGVRLWLTVFEAPAYPEPARFDKKPFAILGELAPDGAFRTILGKVHLGPDPYVELVPRNIDIPPDTKLVYFRDETADPIPIDAPLVGNRFSLAGKQLPGNPRYFVALIHDAPWFIASHEAWRWR